MTQSEPPRATLLFVDDEQENLNLFVNIFKRSYRVFTAQSGADALAILESEPIAVLICDQRMPGLSGTDVLARARKIAPDTVRILVTAYPDLNVAVEAINQGNVRRYLGKPWEPAELRSLIAQEVEYYQLTRRNHELVEEVQGRNTALEKANRELQRLDTVKTELLTNVSHELRTPLVSIRGYTDLMTSERLGAVNPRQSKALKVIGVNVARLVSLIEDLLDLSRLDQGGEQLDLELLDIGSIVEETALSLRARADQAGVVVVSHADDRPLVTRGDRRRMGQVFSNLVENAIKFNRDQGRVTLLARRGRDGTVEVEVSDTGIGIESDHLDRIFDRFYQADTSSTRSYGGTGIGLSLVREILLAHDGTVQVLSTPGEGTTFTLCFPEAQVDGQPVTTRFSRVGSIGLVEVADHEPQTVELLCLHLTSAGYSVLKAPSIQQAPSLAADRGPDVIALDLRGDDASGKNVLQALGEVPNPRAKPLVALVVTNALQEDEGDDRIIEGPLDPPRIVREVSAILDTEERAPKRPPSEDDLAVMEDRPKVLVVDDDTELLDYTTELLTCEGFQVHAVTRGEDALTMTKADPDIRLILLDIAMPGLDGFETCRALRAQIATQDTPIYMLSARVGPKMVRQSLRAGADGYIVKPFSTEDFVTLVARVVGD